MTTREQDRERKRIKREEWKRQGVCISCGKPRDTHRLKCQKCHERTLQSGNKTRAKWKEKGLCTECGKNPPMAKYVVCEKCYSIHKTSRDRNKPKRNQIAKEWRERVREEALTAYGGKCNCCGETEPLFLEIDHISGGGSQHRKTVPGGIAFYRWLKERGYPKDQFQILCRNCNFGKYRNNGICPHRRRDT